MLINKKELEMGIEKESSEHGMSYEEARKTALDHLKERPDYYSVADKAGLEEEDVLEWHDSIFTKKNSGKGRAGRLKNKRGAWIAVGDTGQVGNIQSEETDKV